MKIIDTDIAIAVLKKDARVVAAERAESEQLGFQLCPLRSFDSGQPSLSHLKMEIGWSTS